MRRDTPAVPAGATRSDRAGFTMDAKGQVIE